MVEYITKDMALIIINNELDLTDEQWYRVSGAIMEEPPEDVTPVIHGRYIDIEGDGYAEEFDPNKLKEGDKIVMRKHENTKSAEFEVVCNRFPYCWLRFTGLENDKPKSDKDFLISYDRLMREYDVIEVFRE